jgi:hypothetical protein
MTGDLAAEWWHIVRLVDDNVVHVRIGESLDAAAVQIRLDNDTDPAADAFGSWSRLEPNLNSYTRMRGSVFTTSCKFDPLDDLYTPENADDGDPDQTMCTPRLAWSDQGETTGTDPACVQVGFSHNDCGSATTTGPGFTDTGSLGTGVWVKTRVSLRPFAGRRAQIRWLISTVAFGNTPQYLSYNETPGAPGGFDINEWDDGWLIDDISIRGLLEEEVYLIPDGGDDPASGGNALCGANQIAETLAVGDDLQILPLNASCVDALAVVVSSGPNLLLDSVGSDMCPAAPADFCLGAQARIQGGTEVTLVSPGPGESLTLDGYGSTLSPCSGGLPLYEYSQCDTAKLGEPCQAPSSATVVRGLSTDGFFAIAPMVETRYGLRVRCSSQPQGTGCEDTAEALVLLYPGDQVDEIASSALCNTAETGDTALCDPGDRVTFTFVKPSQSGSFDGFGLYRLAQADLQSPILDGVACVDPAFGVGLPTGAPVAVVEPAAFMPPAGDIAFYLIAHRSVPPGEMAPAGFAHVRAGETVGRFVSPPCP